MVRLIFFQNFQTFKIIIWEPVELRYFYGSTDKVDSNILSFYFEIHNWLSYQEKYKVNEKFAWDVSVNES